jgi:tetratricopeptide (TPR) repeat protein
MGSSQIKKFLLFLLTAAALWTGCPSPKQAVIQRPVQEQVKAGEPDAGVEPAVDAGLRADAGEAEESQGKIVDEEDKQEVPEAARAAFNSGVSAMFSNPEGAIEQFRRSVAADPKLSRAYNNIGLILEWKGKLAEAEAEYNRALAAKADYYPAMLNIAGLRVRKGDLAGAESYVREKLSKFKQSLSLRNKLAQIHLLQGAVAESMKESMETLKIDEKNTAAMLNLAEGYYIQKKYELSQMVLDNLKEIEPGIAYIYVLEAYICLSTRCLAMKNKQEAIASFKKALEYRDDLPDVHNNLGYLYNEAGDYASAINEFKRALAYDPGLVKAQLNLANSLRGNRMYEEAEAEYKKVLASGKGGSEVLFDLGILYLDMEREFKTGGDTIARLKTARDYFNKYINAAQPTGDEMARISDYIKDAEKKIKQKEADIDRENKRKLREAEEKKKKEEAAKKAAEEAEQKRREEETKKAAEAAEKLKQEEAARKAAEEAAAKKSAEEAARKSAEEATARKAAEEAAVKRAKEEDARKAAEEAAMKKAADDLLKKEAEEAARAKAAPSQVSQPAPAAGAKEPTPEGSNVLPSQPPSDNKKTVPKPPEEAPRKTTPPEGEGGKLESDEK